MNREQRQKVFEQAVEDYYEFLELNHDPDFTQVKALANFDVNVYADREIEAMWHGFVAAMLWFKLERPENV